MSDTYVSQGRIDTAVHFCYSPFDDVAEKLIVDVVALAAYRTLCTLLQLVLAVATGCEALELQSVN